MNKYCRICWNTRNWRLPSGDARLFELGDSYVAEYGFGHEEWLFNFEWLLSGYDPDDQHEYKYGFLQPINKYRGSYVGQTFSILLYTVDPSQTTRAVACINNAYVPDAGELSWVLERTREKGWLDLMRQHLRELDISDEPFASPKPSSIANIRFMPENVMFCNPMIVLAPPHKATSIHRYQPLDWDDRFQLPMSPSNTDLLLEYDREDNSPDRSEAERTRPAQPSTVVDPQHSILQNRLRNVLRVRYGMNSVKMERGFVDLKLVEPGRVTFIEIKMERTVKNCIRLALGQLIEYAHYPNLQKANGLLVVGDATPSESDVIYLQFLRDTYKLPMYYAQWSWELGELGSQI